MSYLVSECCSSPPLTNTDVHDGLAICDACREWSGFYEEKDNRESGDWREPINFPVNTKGTKNEK